MKNDYSKVFAMLRPVRSGLDGMAGFARIEMRSGKARMNLNVHGAKAAQDAVLVAALVGNDGVSAFECGRLTAGGRGQFSLLYEFDPGDIGGIALDGYTAAAVVSRSGGVAEPLLAGIFGRRGVNDWAAAVASLSDGVNALYEEEPEEEEDKGKEQEEDNKNEKDEKDKEQDDKKDEDDEEIKKPPKKEEENGEAGDEREGEKEKCKEGKECDECKDEKPDCEKDEKEKAKEVFRVEDDYAQVEKPVHLCAEKLVWQGYSYAMKSLFLKHTAVEPFGEIKDMLFVRVDMPVKSAGADHYILGARAKGDEVERLCIGVPGRGGVIPPAGLEGSQWQSDGRGGGYWLSWQDAYMGYPIRGDI